MAVSGCCSHCLLVFSCLLSWAIRYSNPATTPHDPHQIVYPPNIPSKIPSPPRLPSPPPPPRVPPPPPPPYIPPPPPPLRPLQESAYPQFYVHLICIPTTPSHPHSTIAPATDIITNLVLKFPQSPEDFQLRRDGYMNYTVSVPNNFTTNPVAYGYVLCKGNISPEYCLGCVHAASDKLNKSCHPNQTSEAIVYFEDCLLHYSTRPFFSSLQTTPIVYLKSVLKASDPVRFNLTLTKLLEGLEDQVASTGTKFAVSTSVDVYGVGNNNVPRSLKGMIQCIPDLRVDDCKVCVHQAIADIPTCCEGNVGARVIRPSCSLRYDLGDFYGSAFTRDVVMNVSKAPQQTSISFTRLPGTEGKTARIDFPLISRIEMHPNFSTLFIFISLIIVISILDLAACDDDFDPKYKNCSRRFECGRIRDIGYPFWGDGRADYCGGKVGYQLYCNRDDKDQEIPEIVINSMRYQVLSMSASSKSMSIARSDFVDDPCPANYINSTLDTSLFEYSAANTVNLTLFYDCVPSTSGPLALKQFTCPSASSTTVMYNYFDIRDESIISTCRYKNMVAQVSKVGFDRLMIINLVGQVLKDGFDVEYSMDVSQCKGCVDSGGQCGFDSALQIPTCFCFNGPSSAGRTCLTRLPTNKGKNKGLKILIAISVGASGIMVAIIMFCLWRRKCFLRKLMTTLAKKKTQSVNVELFLINYGSLSPIRFKYSEIKRMTNSFQDKLGKGGYGSVFKGKLVDGRMVAVKLLSESKGNGDELINEIASISRTSHVNIVTLLGFCVKGSKRALVYEFMPNGSLEKFIYDNSQPHLGWKTLYGITLGIARGLEYLHRGCNTRILHFDIKPHNILLDQVLCPKISDFGLSKLCHAKESVVSMTGARGTAGYIAPELIFRHLGAVSHKSDVYSYGMMVLEMVGGRRNVDATAANSSQIYYPQWIYNNLGLYQDLGLQGVTTHEDEETARKMVFVGLWCIQMDPSNRPPINQVLEMLEGSLEAIQIPPNPFLNSPTITPQQDHSNASISSIPTAR